MSATFLSNTIWYVLLGVTSIISIVLTLYKSNNRIFIIGFGLAVLGTTFHIEMALLTMFNAYRYFPKVFGDLFLDASLGNYFSQISITSTVVLVIAYRIPSAWNLVIAGIYYLIEEFFIKLGIYQHHWYKTWYTSLGVLLFIWVCKKWYYYLLNYPKTFIYHISLYLGARAVFSFMILFQYFFSIEIFNIKFIFDEFSRNQAVLVVTYDIIWIIIMTIIHRLNLKWMWKGGLFVLLFIIEYFLIEIAGVITIKNGWFFIITLLNIFGSYFSVVLTDYLLTKGIAARRLNSSPRLS